MTVRLYLSTESGAPQLSNSESGSLLTILRACLVEGFADRTSAGWTLPFSDLPNGIGCFKSVSGDTLRLDDGIDYRFASGVGYKEMTDLDSGSEKYPSSINLNETTNHWRIYKRYSSGAEYDGWAVVASDNWFYFIGFHNSYSPSYPSGFFFGNYEPSNPAFTEASMITGLSYSITSTSVNLCDTGLFGSNEWIARRNYQNSMTPLTIKNRPNATARANPNPATGKLEITKNELNSVDSIPVIMGFMPNRYHMLGSTNLGYRGGEKFEIEGVKYIVMAESGSAYIVEYDVSEG